MESKKVLVTCGLLKLLDGYVLVHEKGYTDQLVKCPGGRIENETPEDALLRELYEEVGFNFAKEDIKNSIDVEKRDHIMRFFNISAPYASFSELKKGEEIEWTKLFKDQKSLEMAIAYKDIVPCHAKAITQLFKSA